jgi:release factor glutamine methyltransferase
MVEAPATAAALLADAARRLAEARIPEPRREASRVWSGVTGRPAGAVLLARDEAVAPSLAERFLAAIARRASGEPLAYVTGSTGFRTLTIRTDRRALIPRPETEGLVELVLARADRGRVADVGTGTGCIALSLRAEGRYDAVLGSDRSRDALALAAENAARCGLRVALALGDLTAPLATDSLDALVSNPPYLTDAEYAELDPAVRAWEPAPALPSGPGGVDATHRLLDDGRRVVRRGGWIALEVDCRRAAGVAARADELGWTDVTVAQDLFGRERYVLARRRSES